MSKLILCSNGEIINPLYLDPYLPKPLIDSKILYITTAAKEASNDDFVKSHKNRMNALELSYEEYDITDKSTEELKEKFSHFDIIHVEGGNPYYLLKIAREAGLKSALKEFLDNNGVYFGTSAGSYLACENIKVATWTKPDRKRFGITDFTALELVPFVIKAHYTAEMEETIKAKAKRLDNKLYVLEDGQALICDDIGIKLISNK